MKIEIELDEKGYCKGFKINGNSYDKGIERVLIDCEYKTKIDLFTDNRFFNEPILEKNNLINIYESKK